MLRLRTPVTVVLLLAVTALVAACGGSSGSSAGSGTNAAAGAGGSQTAAAQKFQQCLKDHGVTLPGRRAGVPGSGRPPGGTDAQPPTGTGAQPPGGGNPAFQKAMAACAKLRPQGMGDRGAGPGRGRQDIRAFVPYLDCLKAKGLAVDVKRGFNALRNLKRDDPKVQAALTACRSKLPSAPQGTPGTPPASTTAPSSTT
jgi:hypothetical protein